ncbi:MAG: oligosaccharide flippase family protein [Salibacteraceae bacterium]
MKLLRIKDFETKVLFKNSSWVLSGNIVRAILGFLRGVIIARGLGAELYGTFTIIAAFSGSVQQFFNFTFSSTIIKFGANYITQKDNIKLAALIKGSVYFAGIVAILSTTTIAILTVFVYDVFLEKPGLQLFILLYAIVSSTMFIDSISNTLLRLFYKFKENSIISITSTALDVLIIGVVIFFKSNDFTYFFFALVTSRLIGSLILNGVTFSLIKNKIWSSIKTPLTVLNVDKKELFNFTIANSGSRAIKTFINNGDVLLLGALLGPVPVAFYNIAKKLAYVILIFIDPLTTTIFPQLSILISDKKFADVKVLIRKITGILIGPSLLFVFVIYFLREQAILWTYGAEYLEATKPFMLLTINAVIGAVLFWNIPLILSLGLAKFRFVINLFALIIGAAVAYYYIPIYGVNGAALGLLCANGIVTLIFSFVAYSKLTVKN